MATFDKLSNVTFSGTLEGIRETFGSIAKGAGGMINDGVGWMKDQAKEAGDYIFYRILALTLAVALVAGLFW